MLCLGCLALLGIVLGLVLAWLGTDVSDRQQAWTGFRHQLDSLLPQPQLAVASG